MPEFKLVSEFQPRGDQPAAIEDLVRGLESGRPWQTLLGVTGSGKTFTMANVIAQVQRPTLVISHNKTLAAQLYSEFKEFFPESAVAYFVSYYDYYQPEAYRSEEHTSELQSLRHLVCRLLLEKKKNQIAAEIAGVNHPAHQITGTKLGSRRGRRLAKQLLQIKTQLPDKNQHLYVFFFNFSGPPRNLPFSPPRAFPD